VRSNIINNDKRLAAEFTELQSIVSETRAILRALKVNDVTLYYAGEPFIRDNAEIIKRIARLQAVTSVKDGDGLHLTSTKYDCWLDINRRSAQAYLEELKTKYDRQAAVIKQLEDRLADKSYTDNAPREIVEQTKQQLTEAKALLTSLEAEQKRFTA
jgi:valyl-tRNA synthetase